MNAQVNYKQLIITGAKAKPSSKAKPQDTHPQKGLSSDHFAIPNFICNSAVFSMRDVRTERERPCTTKENKVTAIKKWKVGAEGVRLDQFDYEVYVVLAKKLYITGAAKLVGVDAVVEVSVAWIVKELDRRNNTQMQKRVKESMYRLSKASRVYGQLPKIIDKGKKREQKNRCDALLKITAAKQDSKGRILKYQVSIPNAWKDFYTRNNVGYMDYEKHRKLPSHLSKALYRYIVGQKKGKRHWVAIPDLRQRLGYEAVLKAPRNFKRTLCKALEELENENILRHYDIKDGWVKWQSTVQK